MPLFRGSIAQLRSKIMSGTLVSTLAEQYRHELGRAARPSEQRSWERSLDVLSQDLIEAGLQSSVTTARLSAALLRSWTGRSTNTYKVFLTRGMRGLTSLRRIRKPRRSSSH